MRRAQKRESKMTCEKTEAAINFMKSLANPNRLIIALALMEGERSVGDLETSLGLRQPSLSQQLAELRESGLVEARRQAKQVYYRISDKRAAALLAALHQIFCADVPDFASVLAPRVAPGSKKLMEAAMFSRVETIGRAV